MNDILNDPIFHWTDTGNGRHKGSLSELLAFMVDAAKLGIRGFDHLQAHQQHPWHAFLVQLAAMVFHHAGTSPPGPVDSEWWKEQLLALSENCPEAWQLVVDDLEKPAFMQPPLPDGRAALKNSAISPDAIDLYQAAKDHDCKHTRATRASDEQWVYALICLQTFQGFSGRGNYGVTRMNGGFGNRPGISAAADFDLSRLFRRDTQRLVERRQEVLETGWSTTGKCILWRDPWDGATQIPFTSCDPYCLEICRRLRLTHHEGEIVALYGASTKGRVSGTDELTGNVGDPWTPVDRSNGKALTLGGDGFSYRKVVDLMLGDWRNPICMDLDDSDQWWQGKTLVRGQGQTEGYHERMLPISRRIIGLLRRADQRQRLGERSTAMVKDAETMHTVLRTALCALAQPGRTGEGSKLKFDDKHATPWIDRLEGTIDSRFFEFLWEGSEKEDEAARVVWQAFLRESARHLLDDAESQLAVESTWRYRAIHHAEGLFYGGIKKKFTALYTKEHAQ